MGGGYRYGPGMMCAYGGYGPGMSGPDAGSRRAIRKRPMISFSANWLSRRPASRSQCSNRRFGINSRRRCARMRRLIGAERAILATRDGPQDSLLDRLQIREEVQSERVEG